MEKEAFYKPFIRIILYYVITVIVSIPFTFVLNKNLILDNFLLLLIDLIVCAFIILLFKDKLQNTFKDFKVNWKKNLKIIFKYWIIGFILMIVTNLIINLFILKTIAPNEASNREVIDKYPIYAIATIVCITPIIEEILFRLNFKDVFKTRKSYCLTTGILFGFMHVLASISKPIYMLYLIPYSILGITFSLVFYDTNKNVLSSFIAHSLHNSLSLLIILLGI